MSFGNDQTGPDQKRDQKAKDGNGGDAIKPHGAPLSDAHRQAREHAADVMGHPTAEDAWNAPLALFADARLASFQRGE